MTIEFRCSCGEILQADEELAGKKGKCPACQKIVVAPAIEHRPEKPEASRKEDVQDAEIFGGESEELLAKLEERPRGPSTGRFKIALKEIIDKVPRKAGMIAALIGLFLAGVFVVLILSGPKETASPGKSEEGSPVAQETPTTEKPEPGGRAVTVETGPTQTTARLQQRADIAPGGRSPAVFYTVNLATFEEKERAERFKEDMKELEIETFVWAVEFPRRGKFYRVSAGRFDDRDQAERFAKDLERRKKLETFVVQIPAERR
jgi:cell division septation protein DedD